MTNEEIEKATLILRQAGLVVSEGLDYRQRILGGSEVTVIGEGEDTFELYSRHFFIEFENNEYVVTYYGPGMSFTNMQAHTLDEAVELIIESYKDRGWIKS